MASTNKTIDDIIRAVDTALGAKARTRIRVLARNNLTNANEALAAIARNALLNPSAYMDRAMIELASDAGIRADFQTWDAAGRPTDGTANDIDVLVTDAEVAAILTEDVFWAMVAERI